MEDRILLYADAYQQLASISAILGGLAFTAAAALLAAGTGSNDPKALNRSAKITVATAVMSAVNLICAALMWSFMAADLSRLAANSNESAALRLIQLNLYPSLALIAGALLFFSSIGASGWIASRKLGLLTTLAAVIGAIALLLMLFLFSDIKLS